MSVPFNSDEIEIPITNSFFIGDKTYFSSRNITPNARQSVNANFVAGTAVVRTRNIPDFTFAAVSATAGVQMIVVRSDSDIKVKFKNSSGTILVGDSTNGIELEAGQTKIGIRDDNNVSLPFDFSIPTSGTCDKIELDKPASNRGGTTVEVDIYYNVATS
jgi:hypothetical protein